MSDNDIQAVAEALYAVESRHHIHGQSCLCGFTSAVSRDRTAHVARAAFGELLGEEFVAEAIRMLDREARA